MQVNITLQPDQEDTHELAEILRAFAADYDSWMIRSIKGGKHTLHDEASTPRGKSQLICCGRGRDFPRTRRTSNLFNPVQLTAGSSLASVRQRVCELPAGCTGDLIASLEIVTGAKSERKHRQPASSEVRSRGRA